MIRLDGLDDLQEALRDLPPELARRVDQASREIAAGLAGAVTRSAKTAAERKAAGTVRYVQADPPGVSVGGPSDAGRMFFGTAFGGRGRSTTRQFRPFAGTQGYWFYPAVRSAGRKLVDRWLDAVDEATGKEWRN